MTHEWFEGFVSSEILARSLSDRSPWTVLAANGTVTNHQGMGTIHWPGQQSHACPSSEGR